MGITPDQMPDLAARSQVIASVMIRSQLSAESGIPELLRIYHVRGKTIAVGVLKLVPLVFLGTNVILRGYAAFMEPSAELFKEASIGMFKDISKRSSPKLVA